MKQESKQNIIEKIFFIFFCFTFIALGWLGNELYEEYNYQREYAGLHFSDYSYNEVKAYTNNMDKYGDWVCVNIRGMDFDKAYETCKHETGHEIFAEYCEKNMEDCINLTK